MIGAIPKGLFGRGMRGAIGGAIGDATLTMPMPQQEPEPPKSFWQGGGKFTGKDAIAGALAVIGDGLSNWSNGGGNTATGALLDSRMAPELERQRMAQEAAKQAQEIAAYRTKKGIDAEFREPPAPDAFERTLLGAGIDPASPQGRELYRRRADSMAQGQDEFVVVPIPGRGTYAGPKSGLPGALGQAPQAPVGKLTPIGGGTAGNSGGGFPSGR